MREGAFRMAAEKEANFKPLYGEVANLAQKAGGDRCRKANLNALQTFENSFLPQINTANSNFMLGRETPVDFGEVQLIGGPHFSVNDSSDREKYVYLHPSRWKNQEVAAFCELLTVVVEKRFDSSARDVWFLDLREANRIMWGNSRKLIRRKCEKAAELLVALQAANLTENEA